MEGLGGELLVWSKLFIPTTENEWWWTHEYC
jgi:hypothetical protein